MKKKNEIDFYGRGPLWMILNCIFELVMINISCLYNRYVYVHTYLDHTSIVIDKDDTNYFYSIT